MHHLLSDIKRIKTNDPDNFCFLDGEVPIYVVRFSKGMLSPLSAFFKIFEPNIKFDDQCENVYRVTPNGNVEKVNKK